MDLVEKPNHKSLEKSSKSKRSVSPVDSVPLITARLILSHGVRKLRSATIASEVQVTESTLFRHYTNLDGVLAATDEWAWSRVYEAIVKASFANPQTSARQILLQDTQAIWRMFSGPDDDRTAATCAFLFMRRKEEFGLTEPSEGQIAFEERLNSLTLAALEGSGASDQRARVIASLIRNYVASVWLTWLTLPVGSDDLTSIHDLSPDEAQMGILMLLDKDFREEQYRDEGLHNSSFEPQSL